MNDTHTLEEYVALCATEVQCNCDGQPREASTGHAATCWIHRLAVEIYGEQEDE